MTKKETNYDAPITEVILLRMETGILAASLDYGVLGVAGSDEAFNDYTLDF